MAYMALRCKAVAAGPNDPLRARASSLLASITDACGLCRRCLYGGDRVAPLPPCVGPVAYAYAFSRRFLNDVSLVSAAPSLADVHSVGRRPFPPAFLAALLLFDLSGRLSAPFDEPHLLVIVLAIFRTIDRRPRLVLASGTPLALLPRPVRQLPDPVFGAVAKH